MYRNVPKYTLTMCPFMNMLWFPSYTAKVFLRARHVIVRGWDILFPLRAALSFDRLHLCGASSSARKSERIYELGRLRLTSKGEVPTRNTHTHANTHWWTKNCECQKSFLFKHILFPWFFQGKSGQLTSFLACSLFFCLKHYYSTISAPNTKFVEPLAVLRRFNIRVT